MRIETPNPEKGGSPIIKEVRVGGGVKVRLEGTRYLSDATVLEIDDEKGLAKIKGVGFEAIVNSVVIADCVDPEMRTYQEGYEQNVSTTHRPEGADKEWGPIGQ